MAKDLSFEDILENLGEGVVCVDVQMKVTVFNHAAEKMTETSRGKVLGRPVSEVFSQDVWIVEVIDMTLRENKVFSDYEETLKRRFSGPMPIGVTTTQIFDPAGALTGAVVLIKDLSGIKSIERDSLRKERLAHMGGFAANLAHEVKNPLGGIRGAAQLLSRKVPDPALCEYTDIIIKEADRLNNIVREMLDFAKPARITKKPLNIHKVLDRVTLLLIEDGDGPAFIKEYDPSLPPVSGDEDKLTQVFLNIIKNATEATGKKKGGEVRLVTRIVTDFHLVSEGLAAAMLATVEVIDNGPGISEENMEKVFTPFFTTKSGGSGLGMAISYRIVKDHEGLMKIESSEDEGTSVSVYLPVAQES